MNSTFPMGGGCGKGRSQTPSVQSRGQQVSATTRWGPMPITPHLAEAIPTSRQMRAGSERMNVGEATKGSKLLFMDQGAI